MKRRDDDEGSRWLRRRSEMVWCVALPCWRVVSHYDEYKGDDEELLMGVGEVLPHLSRRCARRLLSANPATSVLSLACSSGAPRMLAVLLLETLRGRDEPSRRRVFSWDLFEDACNGGSLPALELLVSEFRLAPGSVPREHARRSLLVACLRGRLEVVRWLKSEMSVSFDEWTGELVDRCCEYGWVETARWFRDHTSTDDDVLVRGCHPARYTKNVPGSSEGIHWLLDTIGGRLNDLPKLLKWCSEKGDLSLAKHVVQVSGTELLKTYKGGSEVRDAIFVACEKRRLPLARWLYDEFGLPGSCSEQRLAVLHELWNAACRSGDLSIMTWARDTFPDAEDLPRCFTVLCTNGMLDAITLLLERDSSLITVLSDTNLWDGFVEACRAGHSEVAKWIIDSCPEAAIKGRISHEFLLSVASSQRGKCLRYVIERFGLGPDLVCSDDNEVFWHCLQNGQAETTVFIARTFLSGVLPLSTTRDTDYLLVKVLRDRAEFGSFDEVIDLVRGIRLPDIVMRGAMSGLLTYSCAAGHLDFAEWLVERLNLKAEDLSPSSTTVYAEYSSDAYGQVDPDWIYPEFNVLARVCASDNVVSAQWLVSRFSLTRENAAYVLAFREACACGSFSAAKWLCDAFAITAEEASSDDYRALSASCTRFHLHSTLIFLTRVFPETFPSLGMTHC